MSLTAQRLTDSANTISADTGQPLASSQVEYSTCSPFNSSNELILVLEQSYFCLFRLSDRARLRPLLAVDASSEPRWSRFDPNVFYYHKGNALWRYRVDTNAHEVVHVFTEYQSIGARGESDIGEAGDSLVLAGDGREIFVVDLSSGIPIKGTAYEIGAPWDAVTLSPEGNVLLAQNDGLFLYDRDMNYLRRLTTANGHRHTATDANGRSYLCWDNSNEPNPRIFDDHRIVKIDLETGAQTSLLELGWDFASHTTAPMGPLGWAIVGTYRNGVGGELLRVWLDGRPDEHLLVHGSDASTYEGQPRATVSRDGRWLAYNSNQAGRTDVYLVDLAPAEIPQGEFMPPVVWTASSLQRVGQTEAAGQALAVQLSAARGEYQSFQIAVRAPAGGLSNVKVAISDLVGATGTITKAAFTLYREHYVPVTSSSPDWGGANRPKPPGMFADGLIPFVHPDTGTPLTGQMQAIPFTLAEGKNQPIWVDVLVPRTAQAGNYSGTYTVTSTQGNVTGQITVTVWNFTLPLKPSLRSCFLFWTAGTEQANLELLRHKLEPIRSALSNQHTLVDQFGLSSVGLPFWSGADVGNCTMGPAPSVASVQQAADQQHPDLDKYCYSADEIDQCPNIFETMKQWARNLHAAGVKNLVVMKPTPALYDDGTGRSAVDIWVVLPVMYAQSIAHVSEVISKGNKVWSYNTLVQDPYSPKWLIDFSPVDFRIQPGFINQSLGLTGLLYWRVDMWSADPWNAVNSWGGGNYPGEGQLFYPGDQVGIPGGVAPSMRLKWLRDGVQDYEYIELLKQKGQGAWAVEVARSVGPDWTNWTRDVSKLHAARQLLGSKLHELSGAPAPIPPPPPPEPEPEPVPEPQPEPVPEPEPIPQPEPEPVPAPEPAPVPPKKKKKGFWARLFGWF